MPASTISAKLIGHNPADFQLTGALSAQQIGPIPFFYSLGWREITRKCPLAKQSVLAFQSLIPPDLAITLREGNFMLKRRFR